MENLIEDGRTNQGTGEALEVMQVDQCMYGLVGAKGWRHKKSTGLMVSSVKMKERLNRKCDGQRYHERLEGGNLTKRAQQWPHELCVEILEAAIEEMRTQVMSFAFPAEAEMEDADSAGPMDGILESQDIAESPLKRRKIDQAEVDREEMMEERTEASEDRLLHLKEAKRKETWLRLPKEKRVAIRRLHAMMGHCSNAALIRMLRSSMAGQDAIDAAKHFRCQSCEEMKRDEAPRVVRPTRPSCEARFNSEVAVDVFEAHDAAEKRPSILSVVDMATHYHAAFWVAPGGTPSSRACAEASLLGGLHHLDHPRCSPRIKEFTTVVALQHFYKHMALRSGRLVLVRHTSWSPPRGMGESSNRS